MASRAPLVLGSGGLRQQLQSADYCQVSGIRFAQSVASQTGFASDTLLSGSSISIPASSLKIGTRYKCLFDVTKTGAGLATPIINLRFGTAGTVADTSRGTHTFAAQTAVIDAGLYEVNGIFRVVGASGVLQSSCQLRHRLSITGLSTDVSPVTLATSAAFDTSVANSILSLSVNGGASAVWTIQMVKATLENLA